MACLRFIDETDGAMGLWRDAVAMDMHFVATAPTDMVETDVRWMSAESPAVVVWRQLLNHKREMHSRRTGGQES